MDGEMRVQVNGWARWVVTGEKTDGRMGAQMHGDQAARWVGGGHGRVDGRTDRWARRWVDGQMGG